MRDSDLREWRKRVRERADREWRELSLDVIDELACHLADLHATALADGAGEAEARVKTLEALNAASFLELSKRPRARRLPRGYLGDVRLAARQLRASPIVSIVAVLSLALIPIGHCSAYGPFFSMPTRFLTGAPAAAGIALVVTIANVGGFIGPTLMGAMKDRMGTHSAAFMLLGACGVVAALLALRLRKVAALGDSESAVSAEQQSPAP